MEYHIFKNFTILLKSMPNFLRQFFIFLKNKINKTFIQFFLEAKFLSYGILSNMQEINIWTEWQKCYFALLKATK